ncbi:MAG: hypothetical protein K2Q22_08500, partial [Cytophagales bacterium]|nr:hypothetical protein [Cytophagales bacterium]
MLTTIIEQHLKAIEEGAFQKMINHLLCLEGYKFIGSPGSVIGKSKTSKGSPDSFFDVKDGFIFCEITTQEKLTGGTLFIKKLIKDIDHCFDEAVTGISKDKIVKVILAFNDELIPSEFELLKTH